METKMKISQQKNKKLTFYYSFIIIFFLIQFAAFNNAFSQCKPIIKIDGKATVVNSNDDFGLTLPFWLRELQTLAIGSSVSSISVIEFTANGTTLEFSQVLNVTSTSGVPVPAGKVWKIESIAKLNNSSGYKSATFGAGTFTWNVPACAEEICIEMWGAGGGGGGYSSSRGGGGGGGGGYGSQCFAVTPNTTYNITVGIGGGGGLGTTTGSPGSQGGTTTVSGPAFTMSATGGSGGASGATMAGGAGGSSTASSNATGATGNNGCAPNTLTICGAGGAGANGGAGGIGVTVSSNGNPGTIPGGGGSGSYHSGSVNYFGGDGAHGKVIITW